MRRGLRLAVGIGLAALLAGRSAGAEPVRILPLGDSITEGVDAAGCYRAWLWRDLVAAGVEVDFVGTLSGVRSGPAEDFDGDHEGRWGWRADRVAEIAQEVARRTRPDVVLVHLGHNDLWQGETAEEVIGDLERVVAALRAGAPGVEVLLSTLAPASVPGLEETAEVNARLPGLVERLGGAASGVELVDGAAGFDPATMTVDGVHPNEAGARHLAAAWTVALRRPPPPASLTVMPGTRGNLAAWPGRSFAARRNRPGPRHVDRLRLATEPREAWMVARQLLVSWPRTRLEEEAPGYLRFSERNPWLGIVDDLELALDEDAGAIDVRSESRAGVWDLGANRRRVELLRRRLISFGMVESR